VSAGRDQPPRAWWLTMDRLLHEALERPADQRAQYLGSVCHDAASASVVNGVTTFTDVGITSPVIMVSSCGVGAERQDAHGIAQRCRPSSYAPPESHGPAVRMFRGWESLRGRLTSYRIRPDTRRIRGDDYRSMRVTVLPIRSRNDAEYSLV